MKTRSLNIVILSVLLPLTVFAHDPGPAELGGARFGGPANPAIDSNAHFTVGLTLDGGITYESSAKVRDSVRVIGGIHPEPGHINQKADLFIVDRINEPFVMKNLNGVFVPWNGNVASLVPFMEDVTLTAEMEFDMFIGKLGIPGDHRIFLGYQPEDGKLYYTPVPHRLYVTEETATEHAYSQFVFSISPNIVQTRCVMCHVNGGLAQQGGASPIFQLPLANSTQANFDIFRNLVSLRGVSYILTEVSGGNNHGGDVRLARGSPDYEALEHFLDHIAEDLPPR